MAVNKYVAYGIGTLTIVTLLTLGLMVKYDDTHVCRSLDLSMDCDRLSSTGKTCYPEPDTRKGSKYCREGWEEIATGITVLPTSECEYDGTALAYCCDVNGCEQI
ncbi:hypothetical protein LCGC14_2707100 [marine sediment metagenome]|uniref:Uncharacterized protein n=1 Tax=marine sediment metagenome TaxID=412755 RepID=A0A0F9C5U6_9ZZZZ